MDLPDEISRLMISDRKYVDDDGFKVICNIAFDFLVNGNDLKQLTNNLDDEHKEYANRLIFGIINIAITCAKSKTLIDEISLLIGSFRWSQSKVNYFLELYKKHSAELTDVLDNMSHKLPKIVDIEWKLLHVIESDYIKKIQKPNYILTFKTQTRNGDICDLTFTCNIIELEDILQQFKLMLKSSEQV